MELPQSSTSSFSKTEIVSNGRYAYPSWRIRASKNFVYSQNKVEFSNDMFNRILAIDDFLIEKKFKQGETTDHEETIEEKFGITSDQWKIRREKDIDCMRIFVIYTKNGDRINKEIFNGIFTNFVLRGKFYLSLYKENKDLCSSEKFTNFNTMIKHIYPEFNPMCLYN